MEKLQLESTSKTDKLSGKFEFLSKFDIGKIASHLAGVLFASVALYGFAPFGVAYLARNRGFSKLALISLALTLAGTFLIGERYITLKYGMAICVYVTMLYALTSKGEALSVPAAAAIAAGSVFISSTALLVWGDVATLVSFTLAAAEAAVVFVCVYIFSKKSAGKLLQIGLMTCVVVLAFTPLRFAYMFSAANFLAAAIILVLSSAFRNRETGVAAPVGAGVIFGATLGLGGADMLNYIAVFAVCALAAAGAANVTARYRTSELLGKLAAATGFAAAFFLLSTYIIGGIHVLTLYEIAAAGAVALILPKRMFAFAQALIPQPQLSDEVLQPQPNSKFPEPVLDIQLAVNVPSGADAMTNKRISEVAAMFQNLAGLIGRVFERSDPNKMESGGDVSQLFDTAAERVCRKCKKAMTCWSSDYNTTYDVCMKMLSTLELHGEVTVADIPLHFREKCIRLPELLSEVNSLYGIYRVNCVWKNKMAENRELLGEQYRGISLMLNDLARDTRRRTRRQVDAPEKLTFNVSAAEKNGKPFEENGDCHCFFSLGRGKYAAILSDGMGLGSFAAEQSGVIIEILRNVLENGFDKTIAVKMINSIMGLKSRESYSTADICILDAASGEVEFIKIGAAQAYIKRKTKVETVRANALPVGVLANFEIETFTRTLESGDYIVMLSDGISDASNLENGDWVRNLINNCAPNTAPQEFADMILERAKAEQKQVDDMMCLVIRVGEIGVKSVSGVENVS